MRILLLPVSALSPGDGQTNARIEALPFGTSEKKRLLSLRHPAALCQSLGGLCALLALLPPEYARRDLTIVRGPNGKPAFADSSLPAFSVTHTGALCAAAVSEGAEGEIGIDMEPLTEKRDFMKITQRFFTVREQSAFDGTPQSFLTLWTRKEAYVKRCGDSLAGFLATGRDLPEGDFFESRRLDEPSGSFILSITADRAPQAIHIIRQEENPT